MKLKILTAAAILACGSIVGTMAETSPPQPAQPYAGLQNRPLKALSAEQIADLRAGRGMGLALVAELNGFPGPSHVLELAQQLELTAAQRARVQEMFGAMKAEAIPLGEELLTREKELDQAFATHQVTEQTLAAAMEAIGTTQAKLRTAHLKYHLAMLDVLTPAQTRRYAELRGYAGDAASPSHTPGMHHPGAK
jgi:Spy/CpxP family protein refolding chaperone